MGRLHDDQGGFVEVVLLIVLLIIAIPLGVTACTTRLEEAKARQEEARVAQARIDAAAQVAQARIETEAEVKKWEIQRVIAEERSREAEAKVELEAVKGENVIRKAVADDVTRQSRMYAFLQTVWVPITIAALVGWGLLLVWYFAGDTGPYQTRRRRWLNY